MDTVVKMQAVITQLLAQHGIDVSESDLFLWLTLPAHTERLIIERIDERYLSMALASAEQLGYFTMAPQLFFSTDATGWTPIHLDGVERMLFLRAGEVAHYQRNAEVVVAPGREHCGLVLRKTEPVHSGVDMQRGFTAPARSRAMRTPLIEFRAAAKHRP